MSLVKNCDDAQIVSIIICQKAFTSSLGQVKILDHLKPIPVSVLVAMVPVAPVIDWPQFSE
jgi:hypothetical protein